MKRHYSIIRVLIILALIFGSFTAVSFAQVKNGKKSMLEIAQAQSETIAKQIAEATQQAEQMHIYKRVVQTIFVIIIANLLMFTLIGVVNNRFKDIRARHMTRKAIVYSIACISLIIIFFIWIQNLNSITIFLGVASAGIALALQEVILCIAGWLLILIRHPFEIGDRIEINGVKGDIIDIRIFQTAMLEIGNWVNSDQSTGRIVNVPNSFVFKSANYNYSRGFEFIWNEIPVLVTFESDWVRARAIMMARATKMAKGMEDKMRRKLDVMRNRYMIFYGTLTPIVYVNIKDSGVELTLRYLTEAKKRRATQDQLCREILEDFDKEPNVTFAYPTYRIVKE